MGYTTNNLFWVFIYISCGMSLGILMAISHNNLQELSLAHILDAGFILALLYSVIHRLWHFNATLYPLSTVVRFLQRIHQAGALTMFTGVLLLYGEVFLNEQAGAIIATASMTVMISASTLLYTASKTAPAQVYHNNHLRHFV